MKTTKMKMSSSSFFLFTTTTSFFLLLLSFAPTAALCENLLKNGNFENGLTGWSKRVWSRDGDGCGEFELVNSTHAPEYVHSGLYATRLKHTCKNDWSFTLSERVNVTYEDALELSYWARVAGSADFKVGAVLYNESGEAVSWDISDTVRTNDTGGEWVRVTGSVWVTDQAALYVVVRCVGEGAGEAYIDDIELRSAGKKPLYVDLAAGGRGAVEVRINTQVGTASVSLPGTGLVWEQIRPWGPKIAEVFSYNKTSFAAAITGGYNVTISLTEGVPEVVYTISSDGAADLSVYPPPFLSSEGHVVVPMNEGITFPVTAAGELGQSSYSLGSGTGMGMAFWGVVDNTSAGPGYMAIVDTPDDAQLILYPHNGKFLPYSKWLVQKGRWGYDRVVRYRFFETGGHVRMAKIFREYRKAQGHLVTLEEKRRKNPSVDLLVGAPNIWSPLDARTFVPELQRAGLQRMLWSTEASAAAIDFLNDNVSGVLTSRYDNYQDAMDASKIGVLSRNQSTWTSGAFPDEVVYNSSGEWERGWGVLGKDNKTWYYCGCLCDKRALGYARSRTEGELKTKHYRCRFIDTTTATRWRECYHKDHPMTRSESKEWRMKLLALFSGEYNLVVGSETGHEAAVPYLHYVEGMMSLWKYRIEDAGRNMYDVVYDVPEQITKYQLGHAYRLPLWELVYHDCVVAYWYWGDYNNKMPGVWDKRDLFNALYGVPPMYLINETGWATYRERFVQSYGNTVPIARSVGYSEMLSHEFLTEDRAVQQTTFLLNETHVKKVIVNFGTEAPYKHPETGVTVNAMSYYTYEVERSSEASSSGEDESSSGSRQRDAGLRPQAVSLYLCLLLCLVLVF